MVKSSSTFHKLFLAAAFILLAAPALVSANVRITDALYNPPGADVGHEWIQVTNEGTTTVNLLGYKLFEGGVNHKLTVVVGTSSLTAGSLAIITTDPSQYAADYPTFTGAIFKSSFSLSNTSATIELKNASLVVVDSYSYTAPPVVQAPAPVKAPTVSKASTKTTSSKGSGSSYTYKAAEQSAITRVAALPALPAISPVWLYGIGLAILLILGATAALYAKTTRSFGNETSLAASEFNIE